MTNELIHEMTIASLREKLAETFPDQGAVVSICVNYNNELYGCPLVSVTLKFGQCGVAAGQTISVTYAERFADLCDSIQAQLQNLPKPDQVYFIPHRGAVK